MRLKAVLLSLLTISLVLLPAPAVAHCDTLSGPVIQDARVALDKGDVTPVLKWIQAADEPEIRAAFQKTLAVRSKGEDAREIADRYFFETLVRVHRAGEGAPFTGLKEEAPEPLLVMADKALATGSGEELTKEITAHVAAELRHRFVAASEARRHAGDSVSAGREYVARYVEFMHYLERLHGEGPAQEQTAHQH
jgi:Family of unknown function (DUF6448)